MNPADDVPHGGEASPGEGAPAEAPRRELFSWMLFDFANSSFTTIIVTVVFSVYFVKTVVEAGGGSAEDGTFYWGLGLSASQILVLLSAPVLGALADFSGIKKKLLFVVQPRQGKPRAQDIAISCSRPQLKALLNCLQEKHARWEDSSSVFQVRRKGFGGSLLTAFRSGRRGES